MFAFIFILFHPLIFNEFFCLFVCLRGRLFLFFLSPLFSFPFCYLTTTERLSARTGLMTDYSFMNRLSYRRRITALFPYLSASLPSFPPLTSSSCTADCTVNSQVLQGHRSTTSARPLWHSGVLHTVLLHSMQVSYSVKEQGCWLRSTEHIKILVLTKCALYSSWEGSLAIGTFYLISSSFLSFSCLYSFLSIHQNCPFLMLFPNSSNLSWQAASSGHVNNDISERQRQRQLDVVSGEYLEALT